MRGVRAGYPGLKWSDEKVHFWQVRTLTGHSFSVYSVAFSPDGTRVVSGSRDELVKIWDAATGAEVRIFVGERLGWRGNGGVVRGGGAYRVGSALRRGCTGRCAR